MTVPSWYELLLLAGASLRVWKLIADDEILNPLRRRILTRWPSETFALFLDCPWCLGTYVSLAWWGAWQAWPHWTLVLAALASIWAVVGLVGSKLVD